MTTLNKAIEAFRDCKTADDVANVLQEAGIKGVPNEPCSCPVALFLSAKVDGIVTVGIDSAYIYGSSDRDRMRQVIDLPEPVVKFIGLFDAPRTRKKYDALNKYNDTLPL